MHLLQLGYCRLYASNLRKNLMPSNFYRYPKTMNGVNYNLLNDQVEWLLQYSRFILIKIESKRAQYWKIRIQYWSWYLKSSLTKKIFRYLIIVYSFIEARNTYTHKTWRKTRRKVKELSISLTQLSCKLL